MKTFTRWFWLCLLMPLAACSSVRPPVALAPVGPAPNAEPAPADTGCLVVYSAWSAFSDYHATTSHHSRYAVASDDGKWSREVQNYKDRFDEGPVRLALPPGSYHVTARSARSGRVVVPVVIRPRQTTAVYLDGSKAPDAPPERQPDLVKLPDGETVGWRAVPESSPKL